MAPKKSPKTAGTKTPAPFPTREQVLEFIRESDGPVGKREIGRAFNLTGTDKVRLRDLLRDLRDEGVLGGDRKRVRPPGTLPNVTVIEVTGITGDGDMQAAPADWDADEDGTEPPRIRVARAQRVKAKHDPAVGDRMLAKLLRTPDGTYHATVIKHLKAAPRTVTGVFEPANSDRGGNRGGDRGIAGVIRSVSRKQKYDIVVPRGDTMGAQAGELVRAEVMPGRGMGARGARVIERVADASGPGAVSLISIHQYDIPVDFPEPAQHEADQATPVSLGARADLREIPLVTIDGADARDFDDAVWAAPDDDPKNKGGWKLIVAIADVAHYVRPGRPLDQEAFRRGNSVYFPDRVVPMLPEALSNGLCSLRPKEDRACMAAHMVIGADGKLRRHRFERGLMRSAARLTYEQVQAARDGTPDDTTGPLIDDVIAPLYGAYECLLAARQKRGALEIDLPERRVLLAEDGTVSRIAPVERLDSHKLIEEFMIAANVAAAETLQKRGQPCMFRVHERPDMAKLEALKPLLDDLGYSLPGGGSVTGRHLNRILEAVRGKDHERLVNEAILRAQSQARYQPQNLGHFGLALTDYAHFTSPIRRYADLLVHRALIGGRERDGLGPDAEASFDKIGEHISTTERRAMEAERSAQDRYVAQFLSDKVGAEFDATIASTTRFGLFVRLEETGADGLVPMRSLPDDYYRLNEAETALVGDKTGRTWSLGEKIPVRLVEASPLTGGLLFEVVGGGKVQPARRRGPGGRRGRRTGRRR